MTEEDKKILSSFESQLNRLLFLYDGLRRENSELKRLLENKNLEKYATTGSPEYNKLVEIMRERFGFTSLRFNTLETLVESIGLPKCKLCTHCFDGSSCF